MRAHDEPARRLIIIVGGRAEPRLELMAVVAVKVENDHSRLIGNFAAVGKTGHLAADLGNAAKVDLAKAEPWLLAAHTQQHLAPWIDDKAVAVGLATVLVLSDLRGCDNEG